MRLLLDTHMLLWAVADPGKLHDTVRTLIEDPANEVMFSAASIWEIAIKAALGRTDFTLRPEPVAHAAMEAGFLELPVWAAAAALVAGFPLYHRDPFDRLLVAQAIAGPMPLYTADPLLVPYSDLVMLAGT